MSEGYRDSAAPEIIGELAGEEVTHECNGVACVGGCRQKVKASRTKKVDSLVPLDYFSEMDASTVKATFRALAKKLHPDHGGSAEAFRSLMEARDAARDYDDFDNIMDMMGE